MYRHLAARTTKQRIASLFAATGIMLAQAALAQFTVSHNVTETNYAPGQFVTVNIVYNYGGLDVSGIAANVFVPPSWGNGAGARVWVSPTDASPTFPALTYTANTLNADGFIYNRIDFGFGAADFANLPTSGTLSFRLKVSADNDVDDPQPIRVRLRPAVGGVNQAWVESSSNPVLVQPPPPPTFSNPTPVASSQNTNPPVNQVTAGQEISFTVTVTPAAGATLTETGFDLYTAQWDAGAGRWDDVNPYFTDDGVKDYIGFTEAGTTVVGGQQFRTLANGHTFKWTQVATETPGVRTFTWVVPTDFTNKILGPKFVGAFIGGRQDNLGEDDTGWFVQVNPINQPPQITGTTPDAAAPLGAVAEGAPFSFTVTANEPDGDGMAYAWHINVDGAWELIPGATTAIYAGNIPYDLVMHPAKSVPNVQIRATVTDDDAANPQSAQATWTITRIDDTNRAPNAPTVAITPAGPEFTTQALTATVTPAGDPDDRGANYSEPLGFRYVWDDGARGTVRDSGWTASLTDVLPAASTVKGRAYTCAVTVRDNPYGDGAGSLETAAAASNGVTVINSAPVAQSQSVFIRKFAGGDGSANVTLASTDVDGDGRTYALVGVNGGAIRGTVTAFDPATGTFIYTVTDLDTEFYANNPALIGPDTVQYVANDGTVDSAPATVTITYRSNIPPAAVADTVVPSADGVTPADQIIDEGSTVNFSLTFNYGGDPVDSGDYMASITWLRDGVQVGQQLGVGNPANLASSYAFATTFETISSADGSHPDARNFVITAVGRDHNAAETELSWTITVQNVNRAPSIAGANLVVQGGGNPFVTSVLEAVPQGWADADNDPAGYQYAWYVNNALVVGQVGNTLAGQFAKHDTVHVVVTPNDGRPANNLGAAKTSNTLTILNTVPTVVNQAVNATDGVPTAIDLTAGSADADGDARAYSRVAAPAQGTVNVPAAGNATYTADWPELALGETSPDTFTFKANDGEVDSNTATVTITVTGINDAPTAQPIAGLYCEAYEAADPATSVDIDGFTGDDIDSDDDASTLTYRVSTLPDPATEGNLTFKASGLPIALNDDITGQTVVFTPVAGKRGAVDFGYVAVDRHGLASTAATVSITVGTPLWYPHIAFVGAAGGWVQMQIWGGAAGDELLVETALNDGDGDGQYVMSPSAYILAGSDGLLPGNYAWRSRSWNPTTDAYGVWSAATAFSVENYGPAGVPTGLTSTAGAADGEFTLGLIAPNAQGFQIEIWGPNGYHQVLPEERFMPDAAGVVPLNQPTATTMVFTTAGTYDWQARGFNPLDTAAAADPAYAPAWSALQTFTVVTGGVTPVPGQPVGLYPPADSIIAAASGTTCIAFEWQPVSGAAGYVVYISSVSGAPIMNYVDVGNVNRLGDVCLVPGTYVWFVIPYNADGTFGTYSALTYFDVVQNLLVPIISNAVRTDVPPDDGLTITWNGAAPTHVTIMLFYGGAPRWQTIPNQPVTPDPVLPNTGWVALGTTWGAGNNFVLVQPRTAVATGEFSRLFIIP